MDISWADRIAEAFGLGSPTAPLVPHGGSPWGSWRFDSASGRVYVKRVRGDDREDVRRWWRASVERGMQFERRAVEAGIEFPRPVEPVEPELGFIARVDGGLYRAYEWIDGRELRPSDDVAEWLGLTLARLHMIQSCDAAERWLYGLHPEDDWRSWLDEGLEKGAVWTSQLRDRLPLITETTEWVGEALEGAGDYVCTHRDVEPHNVLVTAGGPVLVDLDMAGPDSASLEAAHAALIFSLHGRREPDADALRRTLAAYTKEGGHFPTGGRASLARRVGFRLLRLSYNLWVSLGHRASPGRVEEISAKARTQLEQLPTLIADVTRWSAHIRPPADASWLKRV